MARSISMETLQNKIVKAQENVSKANKRPALQVVPNDYL